MARYSRETIRERRQRIARYIVETIIRTSIAPSLEEIRRACDVSSRSVVSADIKALEELGLIEVLAGGNRNGRRRRPSRSIRVNWERVASFGVWPAGRVPRYEVAAGEPIEVPDDWTAATDWVEAPRELGELYSLDDKFYALQVRGNSMVDAAVLDGDTVYVRAQADAERSQLAVVHVKGDHEADRRSTLKYVEKNGRTVRLIPANPTYSPMSLPAEKVEIKGIVVWVSRNPKLK